MELKSHLYLGVCLLQKGTSGTSHSDNAAFLIGCIEPDLNATTYLKGTLHGERFRGHNYVNLLPRIQKLLDKAEHSRTERLLYYYRLGKLTHYLADAFTWPHNSTFPGTLHDHIEYEKGLAKCLRSSARDKIQQAETTLDYQRLLAVISEQHNAYLNAPKGIQTDTDFITRITALVFSALFQTSNRKMLLLQTGGAV